MPWMVTRSQAAWVQQATDAWAALEPQAPPGAQLGDLARLDHRHFALLIEALSALTPGEVSQDLQDLAGLRPVAEVFELPAAKE